MSTLLFPLVAWAAIPQAPLFDRFGDPLPAGAVARLGFVRTSTSSPVNPADGPSATGDIATGKPRLSIPEVPCRVTDLSFSPDGKQVVAGYTDGRVRLWDLATQEMQHDSRYGEAPITNLGWAGPGGPLVFRSHAKASGEYRVLDWKTGASTPLAFGEGVFVRAVVPASRTVIVGPRSPEVFTFGSQSPLSAEQLEAAHRALRARPEMKDFRVVTQVPAKLEVPTKPIPFGARTVVPAQVVAVSPDGTTAVESLMAMPSFDVTNAGPHWSPAGLRVVDLTTGRVVQEVPRAPHAVAFTPDGRGLVIWRGPFTDYSLEMLEARTGKVRWAVTMHSPLGNVAVSPDGRWLAATERDGDGLHFLDAATGKTMATHKAGRILNGPDSLAFAPNGQLVARSAPDGTILVWRVPASPARQPTALTADELAAAWRDLAADDAATAFRALVRLADVPASAVPLLRRELLWEDDRERIERLVAGLNAAAYPDRERAERELEALGAVGRPFVVKGLRAGPSLEARTRLEKLLATQPDPFATPAGLRQLRAVEALERIGTADAQAVLERLTEGGADDPLAHEARLSLGRMKR
jgi:WD40 repeat protein